MEKSLPLLRRISSKFRTHGHQKCEKVACKIKYQDQNDLETISQLQNVSARPVMPPNIRVNRSLLLFKLDDMIFANSCEEIKSEIENKNQWCKLLDVFKFKKTKGIKVVFSSSIMAEKAADRGLHMFRLHVPGHVMRKDSFRSVTTCYVCYELNSHISTECPKKSSGYKICSNCSSLDHTWKSCTAEVSRCVNCHGDHNTMSSVCSMRRDAMKATPKYNRNTETYATQSASVINCGQPNLSVMSKTVTCVMLSLFSSIDETKTFQETLNTLLELNELSKVNVGDLRLDLSAIRGFMCGMKNSVLLPHDDVLTATAGYQSTSNQVSGTSTNLSTPARDSEASIDADSESVQSSDVRIVATNSKTSKQTRFDAVSERKIKIFKKKGSPKVTEANVDMLTREKKIVIESNLLYRDYIKLLRADISICSIIELPVREYNLKLSNASDYNSLTTVDVNKNVRTN